MHYNRLRRNGDPHIRTRRVFLTHQPCTVEGYDRLVAGRGLCAMHWARWKRHGDAATAPFRNLWSARDIQRLEMILDCAPDGLGYALPGELVHAALILDRSPVAVRSKLGDLRAARRRARNQALMASTKNSKGRGNRRG